MKFPKITAREIHPAVPPISTKTAEIAWMGALFEGEGCVVCPTSRHREGYSSALRVKFKMCDRDVLERFQRYGGGTISGPHKPSGLGKKDTFELCVNGMRAYHLLRAIWPWLGDRRREQVRRSVVAWGALEPTNEGVKLNKEDVVAIKKRLAVGKHGVGRAVARDYGVTDGMISAIKHGRAWPCVSI